MATLNIGVISDTHNLLRPQARAALEGVDHIIHAGDIMGQDLLDKLGAIAPLTVVRGNNDWGPWAASIPATTRVDLGGVQIYVVHDIATLDINPAAEGIDIVIYGHSHKPLADTRNGVLYLNPGSAGPRRFSLPVSLAHLTLDNGQFSARIVELAV